MADKVSAPAKGLIRVFVYGTLKADHGNHRLIEEANGQFVGYDSVTLPGIKMRDMGGFPCVYRPSVITTKPFMVRGEVWAFEPEGLAALDFLEGHPNFYRREKLKTDKEVRAWMYMLSPDFYASSEERISKLDPISNGLWRPREKEVEHWKVSAA